VVLTGPQIDDLRDAITSAFDEESLARVVRFKLGKDLDTLVGTGPLAGVVSQLIHIAETEGWVGSLIRAVAQVRPQDRNVRAFCEKYLPDALTPAGPDDQIRAVESGLRALGEILADPYVRARLDRFRDDLHGLHLQLKSLQENITYVAKYAALHDRLHTLQFQFFRPLRDAVGLFQQDKSQGLILDSYASELRHEVEAARAEAKGLATERLEDRWITNYDWAVNTLAEALKTSDEGGARRAIDQFRSVLREQSRVGSLVVFAVSALRLPELAEVMDEIVALAGPVAGSGSSSLVDSLRNGVTALRALQLQLAADVQGYAASQELLSELAVADLQSGQTVAETLPDWPSARQRLIWLAEVSGSSRSGQELTAAVRALETATDPVRLGRSLQQVQHIVASHLFRTNAELLRLIQELAAVAGRLGALLGLLAPPS
jgi:hypothetical protein